MEWNLVVWNSEFIPGRPGFPAFLIPEFPGIKTPWFPEKNGNESPTAGK